MTDLKGGYGILKIINNTNISLKTNYTTIGGTFLVLVWGWIDRTEASSLKKYDLRDLTT